MKKRIGVFDSGLGGLTVLKELVSLMPNEDYFVLGDTKNMPYGVKKSSEISKLSLDGFKILEGLGIKALVIACNTATVHGIDVIKKNTDMAVIGVIEPGVLSALENNCKNILLLATESTINSGLIQKLILEKDNEINIEGIAAPDMVLAVENKESKTEKGREIVYKYLDKASIIPDCVMLSCTHFPALEHFILDYYREKGREIKIINPAKKCAEIVQELLSKENLLTENKSKGEITFLTTGDKDKYTECGNVILDGEIVITETKNI